MRVMGVKGLTLYHLKSHLQVCKFHRSDVILLTFIDLEVQMYKLLSFSLFFLGSPFAGWSVELDLFDAVCTPTEPPAFNVENVALPRGSHNLLLLALSPQQRI